MNNTIINQIINFFVSNISMLELNIISTLLCFLLTYFFISNQKIKISKIILISVNEKDNKEKRVAWKFKIVNKSVFTTFVNFDIKLVGINYTITNDGISTQHRNSIPILAGVRELKRNIPLPILLLIRLIKQDDSNINFAYRPLSLINLNEEFKKYEELELNILCTDTLIGKPHSFTQIFTNPNRTIRRGDFSNDGRLNKVNELKQCDTEFINSKIGKEF